MQRHTDAFAAAACSEFDPGYWCAFGSRISAAGIYAERNHNATLIIQIACVHLI